MGCRASARAKTENNNEAMNKIFLGGGQFRRSVFRKLEEWEVCKRAIMVEIDPITKSSRNCVEYESPKEAAPNESPAFIFKSSTLRDNKLYACTSTEVMIYNLPSFQLVTYISLPIFNDLHHVYPTPQGTLLVMVTGLDIVAEVSLDGKFLRHWDVMGEDTWNIFSRDIDYRKVPTTKPHRAHANHIFQLGDEIFATRFHQRDAISLQDPGRRIEIEIQRPHDGFLFKGSLYFTTVDGHVVIVNPLTLKIERIHELNKMSGPGDETLGWCRGLLPLDERFVWVGFTRDRPTKFRENLNCVRQRRRTRRPSHIALYDLQKASCLEEIETEPHGIGVVFTLFQPQSVPVGTATTKAYARLESIAEAGPSEKHPERRPTGPEPRGTISDAEV
jgi:hypothetical protein